ncbi:MAG: H-NS histone family protein [Chlorobi bacterium]|nr:H-NS histone family protein [Chlorobiota bacterium]
MPTILELEAQIAELQQLVAAQKAAGKKQAIEEIKAKMDEFGITPDDLQSRGKTSLLKAPKEKKTAAVKYRMGDNTWSGGKGPKPKWVKELLDKGGNINDYLVAKAEVMKKEDDSQSGSLF